MKNKKYFRNTALMCFLATPAILSLTLIIGLLLSLVSSISGAVIEIILIAVALSLIWKLYFNACVLPDSLFARFLPIGVIFGYYMLAWIVPLGLAHYRFDDRIFQWGYSILTFPYIVVNFCLSFAGDFSLYPVMLVAIFAVICAVAATACVKQKTSRKKQKRVIAIACVLRIAVRGRRFSALSKIHKDSRLGRHTPG